MSFIITYSPHSPYTYEKIECTTNLDDIKGIYPDITNEEYLCGFSAARETDNMFKLLLEKLKEDNLLEDTVIVAFSDHPNKIIISDDETEKLNQTKFTQICMVTMSLGILEVLKQSNIKAEMVAGLSLGEYVALNYAESISTKDTLK